MWLVADRNVARSRPSDHPHRRGGSGTHGSGKQRHGKAGAEQLVPVPRARWCATRKAPSSPTSSRPAIAGWPRPAAGAGAATPGSCRTGGEPRRSPSRGARRGALAAPRAQAAGRRRPGRVPERRQVDPDRAGLGGQAEDRRLPVHHPRAQPRRRARRRRVRAGRHPRPDRGAAGAAGDWATSSSATWSGPGRCACWSTSRESSGLPSPAEQERILLAELSAYRAELLDRPRIVAGSLDLAPDAVGPARRFSAVTGEGLAALTGAMADAVARCGPPSPNPRPSWSTGPSPARASPSPGTSTGPGAARTCCRAGRSPLRPHPGGGLSTPRPASGPSASTRR